MVYHTHENFGTEKNGEFGNCELFAKNFLANIHRYTKNVFGMCTDCSLLAKFFLTNSFTCMVLTKIFLCTVFILLTVVLECLVYLTHDANPFQECMLQWINVQRSVCVMMIMLVFMKVLLLLSRLLPRLPVRIFLPTLLILWA